MIPIIIMGGILGQFSPTEAGIIAVAYIVFIAIPILNLSHLPHLPRDMAMTGLLYSIRSSPSARRRHSAGCWPICAGPRWCRMDRAMPPAAIPIMIMLLLTLLFIIVGDFIDAIPAIIIFMPLIIDLTKNADINQVHMGAVIITTLAFGLITPPYGLCLLMASKFVGVKFSKAMFASLPIYVVFFVAIAFTIFFPEVVLWLPKQLLPQSVGCFRAPDGPGWICPN